MSKKSVADLLHDILKELDDIATFSIEGKEDFFSNIKTQKAITRSYEIIGEIIKRLPADYQAQTAYMRWNRLVGFRDFLAHHYDEVIIENIWVAVEDLPNLRASIMKLLDDLDTPNEEK
ncbi:MAG: HepT-like ribonuclease domain-containing protein [bacterium]|nr:HepT-like ribonuclease domain-containing protein [bacterium]